MTNHTHVHSGHELRHLRHLTRAIWLAVAILATILAIGVFENYQNTPTRGCSKYDASANYWGYTCNNGHDFYQAK